jgi:hypothetical protein
LVLVITVLPSPYLKLLLLLPAYPFETILDKEEDPEVLDLRVGTHG